MQQYNIFQAIIMSFYSGKLYRDVAWNWGGKAFLYLLVLLTLTWIVATIQIQIWANAFYAKMSDKLIEQIPVTTIKDGKLSTPENRPYIIYDPDTNEKFAIIDTSGRYTSIDQAQTKILITQNEIMTQKSEHETRIDKIPENVNYEIDPKVVNSYIAKFISYSWIFIFPSFLLFSFIYRLIQSLVYALIGKLFCVFTSTRLSYGQLIQVSLVAITPAVILSTVINAIGYNIKSELFTYFLITMLYLFFAVLANKNTDNA